MLVHETPLVEDCHWAVGAGLPLALALKVTVCPIATPVGATGWVMIVGATSVALRCAATVMEVEVVVRSRARTVKV